MTENSTDRAESPNGEDREQQRDDVSGSARRDSKQERRGSRGRDEANGNSRSKNKDEDEDDEDGDGDGDGPDRKRAVRDWLRRPRNKLIALMAIALLIVGLIALILWYLEARKWEKTDNAYIQAPVARLSPGVAGHVSRIFVRDNQVVAAGQPLMELSATSFSVGLERAEAELAAARAQVLQARAAVTAARAGIRESAATARARDADADRAERDYRRYASLSAAAVAEQQRDQAAGQARAARETAAAAREAIRTQAARVEQAEADVAAARARVTQAQAALSDARLRLSDARIVAPIAGRVTQFDIEPGDYVTPGQSLAAVVGPARWVVANFKESQLRLLRVGHHVEVRIDAWSDFPLIAAVDSIQAGTGSEFSALPAQNATSNWVKTVQRIPVKLRFHPDAFRNFPARADIVPGMSVSVRAKVIQ